MFCRPDYLTLDAKRLLFKNNQDYLLTKHKRTADYAKKTMTSWHGNSTKASTNPLVRFTTLLQYHPRDMYHRACRDQGYFTFNITTS